MKILAIKTTYLPTGERINWQNGMPKHKTYQFDSRLFNSWAMYIHKLNLKIKGFRS